jgi:hypothetical protein
MQAASSGREILATMVCRQRLGLFVIICGASDPPLPAVRDTAACVQMPQLTSIGT